MNRRWFFKRSAALPAAVALAPLAKVIEEVPPKIPKVIYDPRDEMTMMGSVRPLFEVTAMSSATWVKYD